MSILLLKPDDLHSNGLIRRLLGCKKWVILVEILQICPGTQGLFTLPLLLCILFKPAVLLPFQNSDAAGLAEHLPFQANPRFLQNHHKRLFVFPRKKGDSIILGRIGKRKLPFFICFCAPYRVGIQALCAFQAKALISKGRKGPRYSLGNGITHTQKQTTQKNKASFHTGITGNIAFKCIQNLDDLSTTYWKTLPKN